MILTTSFKMCTFLALSLGTVSGSFYDSLVQQCTRYETNVSLQEEGHEDVTQVAAWARLEQKLKIELKSLFQYGLERKELGKYIENITDETKYNTVTTTYNSIAKYYQLELGEAPWIKFEDTTDKFPQFSEVAQEEEKEAKETVTEEEVEEVEEEEEEEENAQEENAQEENILTQDDKKLGWYTKNGKIRNKRNRHIILDNDKFTKLHLLSEKEKEILAYPTGMSSKTYSKYIDSEECQKDHAEFSKRMESDDELKGAMELYLDGKRSKYPKVFDIFRKKASTYKLCSLYITDIQLKLLEQIGQHKVKTCQTDSQ